MVLFIAICFCCKSKRREEDDVDLGYEAEMQSPSQDPGAPATGRGSSNPYDPSNRRSQNKEPGQYPGRERPSPETHGNGDGNVNGNGPVNGPTSVVEK